MPVEAQAPVHASLQRARAAQQRWAAHSPQQRLQIIRNLRREIASDPSTLAATVPTSLPGALNRTVADTLVAEVLPLLEACRFLEREAAFLLRPRRESTTSRPVWLGGVSLETRRDPFGVILILSPANYPLFLPGVQALQALTAGNAVLWKPAPGTAACAIALQRMAVACGLYPDLLTILDTDPATATAFLRPGVGVGLGLGSGPDKVILTGSAATGRAVLHELADTLTPAVVELSGCDAVFVLEGADLARVTQALTFALRLNGSATCMAPRRLFVTDAVANKLAPLLTAAFSQAQGSSRALQSHPHPQQGNPHPAHNDRHPEQEDRYPEPEDCHPERSEGSAVALASPQTGHAIPLTPKTQALLRDLIAEATLYGAKLLLDNATAAATLLDHVTPEMRVAQTDIFAPILSILRVPDTAAALAAHRACPYALTAAIFGPAHAAESLAAHIHAGTVLINDLIVPTADPRATFSGRAASGYGATRGRDGLLEMTQPRTILRQRSRSLRAYQPTTAAHLPFFASFAQMLHAGPWRIRLAGLRQLIASARHLK